MSMRKILFVVSGPSGVGKGTLVKGIVDSDPTIALSVSYTTRPPRKGERHGVEYFFVSREEFVQLEEENGFLEYDEHFGNLYGTPRKYVFDHMKRSSVILEIDVVGGLKVKEEVRKAGVPVILIMIVPPTLDSLEERILHRGAETPEQLRSRRERVNFELEKSDVYDYVIVNDDFDTALSQLKSIIETEQNKE